MPTVFLYKNIFSESLWKFSFFASPEVFLAVKPGQLNKILNTGEKMKPLAFSIFLLLMLWGNCFALFKLFTGKKEFFIKSPAITETAFIILRIIPFLNIIALAGLWFFQSWAAYLAIACGLFVIFLDIYFGMYYHLYAAVPSALILLFFIIRYWNQFK